MHCVPVNCLQALACSGPQEVITGVINNIQDLLVNFDCDSCCFAYSLDEHRVYTTPRGLRALRTGVNVLDTNVASPCYMRRLEKYADRGCATKFPRSPSDIHGSLDKH